MKKMTDNNPNPNSGDNPAAPSNNEGQANPNPNAGQQGQAGASEPWYNALPDEFKTNPNVTKYDSLEKLLGAKITLDKHFGVPEDQLLKWPNAEDAEGMQKIYDKLGRPESADKYELANPPELEALAPEVEKMVRDKFHELGLNPKQAAALWDLQNQIGLQSLEQTKTSAEAEAAAGLLKLKNQWGGQFDDRLNSTIDYMKQNAAPELLDFLDKTGLHQNPHLIGLVGDLVAKSAAPTNLPGAGEGDAMTARAHGMTPIEAKAKINELTYDKDFQAKLQDPANPGNKAAKQLWANLNAAATVKTAA
jgi:hypothetical protein